MRLVILANFGQGVRKITEILGGARTRERSRRHVLDETAVDVCSTKLSLHKTTVK
jgi:hypothetical protein